MANPSNRDPNVPKEVRFERGNAETKLPEGVPLVEQITTVAEMMGIAYMADHPLEDLDREEPLSAVQEVDKFKEKWDRGVAAMSEDKFIKADSTKEFRPELVTIEFRRGMAKILAQGAVKYSDDNWKECTDPRRYIGALMRHMEDFEMGNKIDAESGQHTLLHAACCLMMLHGIDLIMNPEVDPPTKVHRRK